MYQSNSGALRILVFVLLSVVIAGAGLALATPAAAQEPDAIRSWPPDQTSYARDLVPEDQPGVQGASDPGVFIVDVVVNNTNANLTNTDTANDGETSIAVNPANLDEIVVAAFSGGWGANAPIYHSLDRGITWVQQLSVPAPPGWPLGCPCDWTWDYGRNNQLAATILANSPTVAGGIDVVTGITTNPAQAASFNYFDPAGPPVQAQETNINVPNSLGNADQPWVMVNRDPTTANQDNVYVAWDDFNNTDGTDGPDMRVAVSYGANPPNFTVDTQVGNALGGVNPGLRLAKDAQTGAMWALWGRNVGNGDDNSKNMDYMLNRTTDGGATWSLNGNAFGIVVANADSTQPTPKFGTVNALLGGVHHAAVDPVTGDLYYVYGNRDSGTNNDRLAIRRISSDGSGNVVVGPESFVTGQVEAAIPVVAVTEDQVIGVFYYTFDGFASSDFPIFTAHLAISEDKGATFNDVRLLTFLSSATDDTNNRQRVLGDYMQMQAENSCFYGSFTGNGAPFGRLVANHDPLFFKVCVGPQIQVPSDMAFANTCDASTTRRTLEVCNTGIENLVVESITSSDAQFAVTEPLAGYPVTVSPDSCFPFEASFTPVGTGAKSATLTIVSNDTENRTVTVQASGNGADADINVSMANNGSFGDICVDNQKDMTLQILNQGACNLTINSIISSDPNNFILPALQQFPLILSPDADVDVPVRFDPDPVPVCMNNTARTANITINSDDPDEPSLVHPVSAVVPCPTGSTSGDLDFGELCIGESQKQTVKVCDTGKCNLTVTDAQLTGPDCDDLSLVNPPAFPLVISPDFCFDFVVKFTPDDLDPPNCSLEVSTNDPANPLLTFPIDAAIGSAQLILDPTALSGLNAFPPTVTDPNSDLGCYSDRTAVVRNNGTCPAEITDISAAGAPFSVIAPTQFPIVLPPGEETLDVTVRFAPAGGGGNVTMPNQTTGTLTIASNDPDGDLTGDLCGEAVVQSGGRWLIVDGADDPIASVDRFGLQSFGLNTPSPINIDLKDLAPSSQVVCGNTVNYHLQRENLPPTETTGSNPNSSYKLVAKDGNLQLTQDFTLAKCEFKQGLFKLVMGADGVSLISGDDAYWLRLPMITK